MNVENKGEKTASLEPEAHKRIRKVPDDESRVKAEEG